MIPRASHSIDPNDQAIAAAMREYSRMHVQQVNLSQRLLPIKEFEKEFCEEIPPHVMVVSRITATYAMFRSAKRFDRQTGEPLAVPYRRFGGSSHWFLTEARLFTKHDFEAWAMQEYSTYMHVPLLEVTLECAILLLQHRGHVIYFCDGDPPGLYQPSEEP
jgi:hypothetical protein